MNRQGLVERLRPSTTLLLVLGIQSALIVLRTVHLNATGFQTADEANYIIDAMIGRAYGFRYFFDYQLMVLFRLFSIGSIASFLIFFPIYLAAWTFSFIIIAYKTLSLVTHNVYARDFTLLALPFVVSYSVLSVGLLSEGPGLTMCMLGIYAWVRYAKLGRAWYLVALGSAAFVAASYCREPYGIFPVVGSIAWGGLAILRRVPVKHAVIFMAISLLIAAPTSPLYGAGNSIVAVPATVQAGTQGTSASPPQTGPASSVSGWGTVIGNSMTMYLFGLLLGWGPVLFTLSAVSMVLLLLIPNRRKDWLLLFFIILSLATFYGSVFAFYYQLHFFLTQGLSNLIRLTNTTVPGCLLLIASLYDRLSRRKTQVIAVALVTLTVGMAGFYVTALQTNFQLPYNILDFNHVNAPLQAREYFQSVGNGSRPVVFLSNVWAAAELYNRDIPGIRMYPTIESVNSSIKDLGFTNALFTRLHPTVFYVLSEIPLSNWNSSASVQENVQRVMYYQSVFLYKTFGALYHLDTSSFGGTPYSVDSVQVVFSTPTGFLLRVQVSWSS